MKLKWSICTVLIGLVLSAGYAQAEERRTSGRTADGIILRPFLAYPDPFAEFKPKGWDTRHYHPEQWQGMDWDTAAWNSNWTPETTLDRMYKSGVLYRQYLDHKRPIVEVGPRFYEFSDLDQRRTIKLLCDYFHVFEDNTTFVEMRDWKTHDRIGVYTQSSGMLLD